MSTYYNLDEENTCRIYSVKGHLSKVCPNRKPDQSTKEGTNGEQGQGMERLHFVKESVQDRHMKMKFLQLFLWKYGFYSNFYNTIQAN